MLPKSIWIAVFVLTSGASTASAQKELFDLVPADAAAALVMRNLDELRKKGDALVTEAALPNMTRPSDLFQILTTTLNLQGKIETDGRAALILVNPEALGIEVFDKEGKPQMEVVGTRFLDLLVMATTVKDIDAAAGRFNVNKGRLKPNTVVAIDAGQFPRFLYLRNNVLFIGHDEKAVTSAAKGKRIGANLQGARNWAFQQADTFLVIQRKPLEPVWKDFIRELTRELLDVATGDQQKTAQRFLDALGSVDATWFALRVDKGVSVRWVNTFPDKLNDEARKLLASLNSGHAAALTGLPDGPVLFAEAFDGDGAKNAVFVRLLFNVFLKNIRQGLGLFAERDRWMYVGVFTEIWKLQKGSRLAIYQNADRMKHGLASGVAILDTEDGGTFLRELRQMIGLAQEPANAAERKEREPSITQLIRDLGDDQYAVRESASIRLLLVGEPALPQLEIALKSDDAEVRRRAQDIKDQIVQAVAERRKELLAKDSIAHLRPTFAFSPTTESLMGQPVEIVRVKLGAKEAAAVAKLRELFGPDWDRIRLAVRGKKVVALLGSDQVLLKKTLANIEEAKPGLAASKSFNASSAQRNPNRGLEFHVSLAKALALWNAADLTEPKADHATALTAFAVTVSPELLELDLWLPIPDIKVLTKLFGH